MEPWLESTTVWAEQVFGGSRLGDRRRDRRLVRYAGAQAQDPQASTAKACEGSKAEREGAYRLLENRRVQPKDIDEGPYAHCAAACADKPRLLAIQDTTSVKVQHQPLADELREAGSPTGFVVHTLMMVDGESGMPLGIADQQRWVRDRARSGKATRKQREYRTKESVKWEESLKAAANRLPSGLPLISVCDREADIYEFLSYHLEQGLDFVVRASWNRRLANELGHVFEAASQAPVVAHRTIRVEQRGGQAARPRSGQAARPARPRRDVETQLQATAIRLRRPQNRDSTLPKELALNVVRVAEIAPADTTPLEWVLLTTLPIANADDVEQVVRDYEHRWLIEQFHKCWKTGCRVEARPLQTLEAVERMLAVTASIGIRILQLQVAATQPDTETQPTSLDDDEWRCLWLSTEKGPLPKHKPSAQWAYRAVAKLGGWYDSKRTGRAGWQTLWDGWTKLQIRLQGWRAAQRAAEM